MKLSIETYDTLERDACRTMGIAAERAFAPITFLRAGYPVKVMEDAEIARFVDSQHEFQIGGFFDRPFAVTEDEAGLIAAIADDVTALTVREYGRPIRPWSSPFSALQMFRIVAAMAERLDKKNYTVLEIGPGSGYLGALLLKAGQRHISMDNTQAFYLWQNRFFGALAGEGFRDLATDAAPASDDAGVRSIHIPWWRFVDMAGSFPFAADFVVCDHAINELSQPALTVILRVAAEAMAKADDSMFLFSEMGVTIKGDSGEIVFAEFNRAGFDVVFKRLFHGLMLRGSRLGRLAFLPSEVMSTSIPVRAKLKFLRRLRAKGLERFLEMDAAVPLYNPSGSAKRLQPRDVITLDVAEAPFDFAFVDAAGWFDLSRHATKRTRP